MSAPITGLDCPRCGGIVPVPEGLAVVACPYCDQRAVVSAPAEVYALPDRVVDTADPGKDYTARVGVMRYQAPLRVKREQAEEVFRRFVSGKFQVARDCARVAKVSEVFLVHLPFWTVWGRGTAWAFGQQQVGSGDNKRYEPREKKAVSELNWNTPACEVGEFGVRQVRLDGCPLEPFNAESLHRTGMVFEPTGSAREAFKAAQDHFASTIRESVELSRTEQVFVRLLRPRLGLVYYPLWVVRYLYRGRSFQVVVDGVNGDTLYGKAPGSVGYRAAVLVGGMAAGAVLTVDVPAAIVMMTGSSDDEGDILILALLSFVFGIGLLWGSYRTFRHGEHYEYHKFGGQSFVKGLTSGLPAGLGSAKDIEKALKMLK